MNKMKAIIKQFFLHGVGNRFFQSAKILYSNLQYLCKNNIQDLEIKNQKFQVSFENRKLIRPSTFNSSNDS